MTGEQLEARSYDKESSIEDCKVCGGTYDNEQVTTQCGLCPNCIDDLEIEISKLESAFEVKLEIKETD